MFQKIKTDNNKLLVQLLNPEENHEVYEPIMRKLGGMWSRNRGAWIFDQGPHEKLDEVITKYNIRFAEKENKEYYTKFSEEPSTYNTPSSTSSHNSGSGLNEAFELIQELFDRVSELETTIESLRKKLNCNIK